MKKGIIIFIVIVLAGLGVYYFINNSSNNEVVVNNEVVPVEPVKVVEKATSTKPVDKTETVIGKSVEGRDITAYHFGSGDKEILFVGGIHGGYEWNTSLLAFELIKYLKANPNVISSNVKVTVIPVLNPDGLFKVVGTSTSFNTTDVSSSATVAISGRFNANTVDLNRNFDCDWKNSGTWQSNTVSGGNKVFSEPESQAIKKYVETSNPTAVIVWYSAAGGVYSSSCNSGISAVTTALTNTYATASGYPAYKEFDSYETTGDMTNWLAKINVPAISVLLTNHNDVEWTKNLAGIKAILNYYAK